MRYPHHSLCFWIFVTPPNLPTLQINQTNYQSPQWHTSLPYNHCSKTKHFEYLNQRPKKAKDWIATTTQWLFLCFKNLSTSSPFDELQASWCLLISLPARFLTSEFFMEMHHPTFNFSRLVSPVWHKPNNIFTKIDTALTHPQSPPLYS
jgi:hypothetical protein